MKSKPFAPDGCVGVVQKSDPPKQTYLPYATLLASLLIMLLMGCNSDHNLKKQLDAKYFNPVKTKDSDRFTSIKIKYAHDTTGLKHEIIGLLRMLAIINKSETSTFRTHWQDSLYTLRISPKLSENARNQLHNFLDLIIRYRSTLNKAPQLKLVITEQDPEILDLLHVNHQQEFPINLNYDGIQVLKTTKAFNTTYSQAVKISSLLYMPTINHLPNIKYNYSNSDNAQSELSRMLQQLVQNIGGFKASYQILADTKSGQASVDSLMLRNSFEIDSSGIYLNVKEFTFESPQRYMPVFHDDSLWQETFRQLPNLNPYLYRLLLTPNLCIKMASYAIE